MPAKKFALARRRKRSSAAAKDGGPGTSAAPTEKVVGTRMGNVKHSGLLATDEALRTLVQEEEEQETLHLGLVGDSCTAQSDGERDETTPQRVTGRELYAIQNTWRPTGTPRMKKPAASGGHSTPAGETDSQGEVVRACGRNEEVSVTVASRPKSSVNRAAERKQQKSSKRIQDTSDDETDEELEADKNGCNEVERRSNKARDSAAEVSRGRVRDSGVAEVSRGQRKGGARIIQTPTDSEQEGSETSEEEDEDPAMVAAQLNRGCPAEEALEDYFTAHTEKAGPTSDHTLSRLSRPRLEQATVQSALKNIATHFRDDCLRLLEEHRQLYPYWLLQMHSGFNILLYGLGSKKMVMEDFCKSCLSETCHLVVNGYFPGLTLKQVLSRISSDLLDHSGSFKSLTEHAQFIHSTFEKQQSRERGSGKTTPELFMIVHNIDGPMLRHERAQAALSILASSKSIHFLASVDHINSALLWDHAKVSRFNWAWHDVTTFEIYREETSYENSLLVRQTGSLALSSLTHVLQSLTTNARGIFELLARHQLEGAAERERGYQGLSFAECYRRCRERFLVNSDLTLRAQLTEFVDHKLVRLSKGSDGVEYLSIPVDHSTLTQFMSEFNDE